MNGHMEYNEIVLVLLLSIGVVGAIVLLTNGSAPPAVTDAVPAAPPPANAPVAAAPNQTAETAAPQPAEPPQTTDKNLGWLLGHGLDLADSWFYSNFSGTYDVVRYTWSLSDMGMSPDSEPVRKNDLRASVIRFDGRYLDSLRGFAFAVYTPSGDLVAPMQIRGTMVFLSNYTLFTDYLRNSSTFHIDYDPAPSGTQRMDGCTIVSGEELLTGAGNAIMVYDFHCEVIYSASP